MASKNFVKPVAQTAINYPAHDFHRDEQVAIAADPYDTPEKAKIFSIDFAAHGLLPIFLIVTNDGDQPVSIANMEITLITAHRSKLTPIATDDLYRRLSNPAGQHATDSASHSDPASKVKGAVSQKEMDEIDILAVRGQGGRAARDAVGIPVLRRRQTFRSPLAGANIDVTGVSDAKGNELMYFEIPMDKYLNAPQESVIAAARCKVPALRASLYNLYFYGHHRGDLHRRPCQV